MHIDRLVQSWLAAAFLGTAVLVAGCGTRQPQSAANNAPANTTAPVSAVTLTLSGWSSSPAELAIIKQQIAAFEAANPGIKVTYQPVAGDYNQKLQTQIASHTEPDVFYLDSSVASDYMAKGVLEPLDPYLASAHVDPASYVPALLQAFQQGGHTYGLPKGFSTLGLFYNTELFAKAGIKEPPATWSQLAADATKLTGNGRFGLTLPDDLARYGAFVLQAGGHLVDAQGNMDPTSAPFAEALNFYADLHARGVAPTPKEIGAGWAGDAFAKGKVAMAIEGNWLVGAIKQENPNLPYKIAELPSNRQKGDLAFTVAYVMGKDSKHKEAAFTLIAFLTGPVGEKYAEQGGLEMPSQTSLLANFKQDFPAQASLADAYAYATPWQLGQNGQKKIDAINTAIQKVFLKKASVATALEEAKAALATP